MYNIHMFDDFLTLTIPACLTGTGRRSRWIEENVVVVRKYRLGIA